MRHFQAEKEAIVHDLWMKDTDSQSFLELVKVFKEYEEVVRQQIMENILFHKFPESHSHHIPCMKCATNAALDSASAIAREC